VTTEVIVTADFEKWWDGLAVEEQKSVAVVVAMLEERGATLPFPYSSGITGSTKLRELRVQHGGKPYRILNYLPGCTMPSTPNAMRSCC
jgi:hypothetical protein